MRQLAEKALSWSPVFLLVLVSVFLWLFLFTYKGPKGGETLLQKVCAEEQITRLERDPFVVLYRSEGCGRVSTLTGENTSQDLLWWEAKSKPLQIPEIRRGTVVDIREGELAISYQFGQPGAIQIPPEELYTRRYLLAKGINALALKEAFPQTQQQTLETVAGAMSLGMLGKDSIRVFAPDREVALQNNKNLLEALQRCPGTCSFNQLLPLANQR